MHLSHLKDKLHRKSAEENRAPEISTSSSSSNSVPGQNLEDQGPPPYSVEPQSQTANTTSTLLKDSGISSDAPPAYGTKDDQSQGTDNRQLDDLDREDQRIQELKSMHRDNNSAGFGPFLINGVLATLAVLTGGS